LKRILKCTHKIHSERTHLKRLISEETKQKRIAKKNPIAELEKLAQIYEKIVFGVFKI
jgi:hypothetical protein